MQVVLVMFRGDGERRSFSIARDMTVIGRREDCDLRIPVGDVSRKHCRIMKDEDFVRVEDLGSSNGTHVNGERIQEALLKAGDWIQIGPVQFIVQIDGSPTEEELSRPASAAGRRHRHRRRSGCQRWRGRSGFGRSSARRGRSHARRNRRSLRRCIRGSGIRRRRGGGRGVGRSGRPQLPRPRGRRRQFRRGEQPRPRCQSLRRLRSRKPNPSNRRSLLPPLKQKMTAIGISSWKRNHKPARATSISMSISTPPRNNRTGTPEYPQLSS